MNTSKLKGKMIEQGLTQEDLAKKINVDRSTLNRRLKTGESFTIGEVNRITTVLNLTKSEAIDIFLPELSQ